MAFNFGGPSSSARCRNVKRSSGFNKQPLALLQKGFIKGYYDPLSWAQVFLALGLEPPPQQQHPRDLDSDQVPQVLLEVLEPRRLLPAVGRPSISPHHQTQVRLPHAGDTRGGLFGNTQNKGFGFSSGLASSGATGTGFSSTGLGFGGFGGIQSGQTQQGGLFNQQGSQSSHLINTASALSAPSVLSDERDSVLAKWNQLQAFWGTGRGYFNSSTPPVEFSQENPFCRFKAVGYSCVPETKDEDGLVALALSKKESDVRSQQQHLVESLHKVLGGNQMISVNVEGVRALPDDHFMEQMNVKSQLQQLSVIMTVSRTALSATQLKQLLQNPPAGVDPIIWEQAKVDNPDPESFSLVSQIISNDISELQVNQATTAAKITQYKRKLMDLSHRVLQEVQRKSGYAIQLDEEHLRVQLETIQCELNAPTQFKGRLNELMSQIRMQNHFGAVRSEERYRVDADLLREIKQARHTTCHLKQQQEGLSHLISVIKDDMDDIKMIEDQLHDGIHTRSSKLS
ncbi:Nucleoporin p54 54 kDa nucleoporin [Triplophysa tibetana]|uniref:Nucleoporin p54 54 kDa nucleoporin n=1 Tax=Triplophysa tibetana TaxID=1572043 RepID=A0A5A9PCA8_9TELE|nr:Nucleoporin p54 54 kDa nucleoporin [Triplophysa tibetana]